MQCFQHSFGQVFVFANDCIAIPDVHHLLDNTQIHILYKTKELRIFSVISHLIDSDDLREDALLPPTVKKME